MRQQTIRKVITVIAFLVGFALLLSLLSWVYRPRDNTKEGGMDYVMANGYLGEAADSIDVFFIGSSEFYSGVSPMVIWERNGITSYDLATGAQRTYNADAALVRMLKTHQPKLVVLDGYVALKQGNPDEGVFAQLASWFNVLDNHENWKKFGPAQLAAPAVYTHREINKGFRANWHHTETSFAGYMTPSEERWGIPLLNRMYLDHMRAVCARAGVQVMFLVLPSPENWDWAHHNSLQDYADAAGVPLLDLNLYVDELNIDPSVDFRDEGDHLNVKGARKVSEWLADWLRERYELPDRREEAQLALWHEDLEQYPEW